MVLSSGKAYVFIVINDLATFLELLQDVDGAIGGSIIYDVYAGSQGFIKYDLQTKTAATPFISYKNISRNLYPHFEKMTGGYILIDDTFMAEPPKQVILSKKRLTTNSSHKKSPQ